MKTNKKKLNIVICLKVMKVVWMCFQNKHEFPKRKKKWKRDGGHDFLQTSYQKITLVQVLYDFNLRSPTLVGKYSIAKLIVF